LRKDFEKIVSSTQAINNLIVVDTSTNGVLTSKICSDVKNILKHLRTRFEVGVSIDGIREVHNEIRGVDSFDKAMKTFFKLRDYSKKNRHLGVHVNHTLSNKNSRTFKQFLNNIARSGVELQEISIDVVRKSPFFGNFCKKTDSKRIVNSINHFLTLNKKITGKRNLLRRRYLKELRDYLTYSKRSSCFAGFSSVYVDAVGNVFPCTHLNQRLGSLRSNAYDLNRVFFSKNSKTWRRDNSDCRACLSGCEGITSIITSLPKTLF
jgi:sulfatase maturation enzyme AslB (radical SAM superfamily)